MRPTEQGATRAVRVFLILLLQAVVSCRQDAAPFGIHQVGISANPDNTLSAVVNARVSHVTQARINFAANGHRTHATPDFDISSVNVRLPVLGLMPNTTYDMWITVLGEDGTVLDGPKDQFSTGEPSLNLPAFQTVQQGTVEPGYTMLAWIGGGATYPDLPPGAGIIIDHRGRVVWYRQLDGWMCDWQKQPDGSYTASVNDVPILPSGESGSVYYQLDTTGGVTRTWQASGPWFTDNHEIRLMPNGDALLMATNWRTMDLTAWGGTTDQKVYGNILQRVSPSGEVVFAWDFLDHFSINQADPLILKTLTPDSEFDFTHANAIDVMADGNYLVSMRHLSQVIKIDSSTGDLLWKLGGIDGDFAFEQDPLGGFSFQHAARELPNGNILLFDNGNGHHPPQSRAVEYQLDLDRLVAKLVWQFNPEPHLYGFAMGFTQRLSNGNTLITYGFLPVVQEVTPSGQVVWELRAPVGSGWIYRATRIASLY
jgi:hypothetical protein